MNGVKVDMINKAKLQFGDIYPVGDKSSLDECFTILSDRDTYLFWFNDKDNSTHTLQHEVI